MSTTRMSSTCILESQFISLGYQATDDTVIGLDGVNAVLRVIES